MKALFICNQNQNRSRKAKEIFSSLFETRSAGLYNENPVSESDLEWADIIIVMEELQRTELSRRFPKQYIKKQIFCLEIPDIYDYNQTELDNILKQKMDELQPLL